MATSPPPSKYLLSPQKRIFDLTLSIIAFAFLSPLFIVLSLLTILTSGFPILYSQKRLGHKGKVFKILKFRTMGRGAERQKWRYQNLNEAAGPVFKIANDPRFVGIGRFLARTGLDELPQLVNIIKGNMSLVGPRPLPIAEASKLKPTHVNRHLIKPGLTSSWVISGSHSMPFSNWMSLDLDYLKKADLAGDLKILTKTTKFVLKTSLGWFKTRRTQTD